MKEIVLAISIIIFSINNLAGQLTKMFELPKHDSLSVKTSKGHVYVKKFYDNNKVVAHAGYKVNHMMETPFSVGYVDADSSWTIFEDLDYTYLLFKKDTIDRYEFSASANNLGYTKSIANGDVLIRGNYYVVENHIKSKFDSGKMKYKIGLWKEWDNSSQRFDTIDYDNRTINGKELELQEEVHNHIQFANQNLIGIYGEAFFIEFVKLNLDKTKVRVNSPFNSPNFPSGKSILSNQNSDIKGMDIAYNIVLNNKRYDIIEMRIDSSQTIIGNAKYRGYRGERLITRAFDRNNNKLSFHENLLNWEELVKKESLDTDNKEFVNYFKWENCDELNCDLIFIVKGPTRNSNLDVSPFYKTIKINPWTGATEISNSEMKGHGLLEEAKN